MPQECTYTVSGDEVVAVLVHIAVVIDELWLSNSVLGHHIVAIHGSDFHGVRALGYRGIDTQILGGTG